MAKRGRPKGSGTKGVKTLSAIAGEIGVCEDGRVRLAQGHEETEGTT